MNFIEKINKTQFSFSKIDLKNIAVEIWWKMSIICTGIESSNISINVDIDMTWIFIS